MIKLIVFRSISGNISGFECQGHAGFSEYGHDVVCAGVSALVISTVNSIEKFTDDVIKVLEDEDEGHVSLKISGEPSKEAELLLSSMVLGIESIAKDYGNDYIRILFKEVKSC